MHYCPDHYSEFELIDTLWNVNDKEGKLIPAFELRINRYIMECKYSNYKVILSLFQELIDTLWNVNTMIENFLKIIIWN